jgi:polysaccharide export outer membrane protein
MKHPVAALTLVCAGVAFAASVSAQSQPATPTQSPAPKTATSTPASPTGLQPLTAVGTPATIGTATVPAAGEPKSFKNESKSAPKPVDPRTTELSAYQIGAEDLLDISVWKNVELSRVVPVRPDGKVSLPLVNDIQAAGLTPTELRDQITTKLAEYIPAPEVSVMVREVHSRKVAVVGAVKMPGRYEMKSPMTVLEALALAQGLSDFASRDRIVVLREVNGKATEIPFNYRKIGDNGSQQNFFLRPGDIVVVP